MRTTKLRSALIGIAALGFATVATPGIAQAAEAQDGSCPYKSVCFYTGYDRTGDRCVWDVSDPDTTSGTYACSWADDTNVRSIVNNGSYDGPSSVAYWTTKDMQGSRVGCTSISSYGDLAGTYEVHSLKWVDSCY